LALESEQVVLFENAVPIKDPSLLTQFEDKKAKADNVLSRLKDIMTEEERPSIAFMDRRCR